MGKEAATKAPTKTEILTNIAETTGLTKKQVQAVFDAMNDEISKSVGKKGPGAVAMPGLCTIVRQNTAALPRREVRKPATGQMVWAEPKPARNVVKVRPLKALKDMV